MDYGKTIEETLKGFQEDANRRIAEIQQKINSGAGTYGDALHLASRSGRTAGKAIGKTLAENAVNGAADPDLTKQVVPRILQANYRTVTAATEKVQTDLNTKAGIHLKARVPSFNQDRSDGLVKEIIGKEDITKFAPVLSQQIENASMSIVDESVRQNADFHYRAGLSPKIVRTADNNCCEWCSNLEGTYSYPCKRDVYRRHENCRCVVEYDPGTGKVQNAHTKRIYSKDSSAIIRKANGKSRELEQARIRTTNINAVSENALDAPGFTEKFATITNNETVNESIKESAIEILQHRSGTDYEDLYLIDRNTGEKIYAHTSSNNPESVTYTNELKESIQKAHENGRQIIAVHNHPNGLPPSLDDGASAFEHGYDLGVVCGHNLNVWTYTPTGQQVPENVCEEVHKQIARNIVFNDPFDEEIWYNALKEFGMIVIRK